MTQIVQSTADSTSTKLTYVVAYPLGYITLENGQVVDNAQIASDTLASLVMGGGVALPNQAGWEVHVINNDTGEVTMIGKRE